MLSCKEVLDELAADLEGEVSAELRELIQKHLAHCRSCTVIYDSTRKTLQIVTDSDCFDLPDETAQRLTRDLLARLRSSDSSDT